MLHRQKNPEKIRKAYACAAVSKMMGVTFFYFTYKDVDFTNRTIDGKFYKDGKWVEEVISFPSVIFNADSPKTKEERQINRLLKHEIPYTSFPIGNKYAVFKRMYDSNKFKDLLIPSFEVKEAVEVVEMLHQYKEIIIKPKNGNKGRELIYIKTIEKDTIIWKERHEQVELNIEAAINILQEKIVKKSYILQPFIECKTQHNHPFDFRVHIQKDGEGKWVINTIYPRVGQKDGIVSNVHSGGYRVELEGFLQDEFPASATRIMKRLSELALQFPVDFELLYDRSLDELGIDVALVNGSDFKIFEVNWRPGCKFRELETAQYHIEYALYLAKQK